MVLKALFFAICILQPQVSLAHLRAQGKSGHELSSESDLEHGRTTEHHGAEAEQSAILRQLLQQPDAVTQALSHSEVEELHAKLTRMLTPDHSVPDLSHGSMGAAAQFFAALQEEPVKEDQNMLSFDMSKMKVESFAPLLVVMACIAIISCVAFEIGHSRHYNEQLQQSHLDYGEESHQLKLSKLFAGVIPLVKPYLFRQDRLAWCYITVLTVLGVWELGLSFVYTLWMKDFWDVMEHKQFDKFYDVMKVFCVLLTTLILVGTYRSYVGMMFLIHWRTFMTDWLLGRWLANKAYYRMQLEPETPWMGQSAPDNPDQRLQEDIQVFISSFLELSAGLFAATGKFVTMLPLLLVLSPTHAFGLFYCPGWLLYIALIYSGLGTLAAHQIGKKLILVNFARQKYEANFRYNIVQVRDNAESIALYSSERCEEARLKHVFEAIVHVWYLIMVYTKRLSFFTAFYGQTNFMFPYIVLAPSYFRGQISLGTLFMLFRALGSVKEAFDWIIATYPGLTDFRATVDRLHNFQAALLLQEEAEMRVEKLSEAPTSSTGAVLAVSGLSVQLPKSGGSRSLWHEADLTILPGQFILLTAPEGSGKSCFFRAISGIWPTASGQVYMPQDTLFVPQKSFIPQGSLKQAVTYPESHHKFDDNNVAAALKAVGLDALADKDLLQEGHWQLVLSGGEQQRLAIAHVVLMRPKLLFLDEATSAMGREGALQIYGLLHKEGTLPKGAAVVSISHQADVLGSVHDMRFMYNADKANWVEAFNT